MHIVTADCWQGLPAIAVSLDDPRAKQEEDYAASAKYTVAFMKVLRPAVLYWHCTASFDMTFINKETSRARHEGGNVTMHLGVCS